MSEGRAPLTAEQAQDAAHLLSEALECLVATPTQRAYVEGALCPLRSASEPVADGSLAG